MIPVYFCFGVMLFGALAAGLLVGGLPERGKTLRFFLAGLGITVLCSLPFIIINMVNPKLGKDWLWRFVKTSELIPEMIFNPGMIPDRIIFGFAGFFLLIGIFLYVIAFNCRKTGSGIFQAAGAVLLFGSIWIFCSVWGFYGLSTLIQLCRKYSESYPTLAGTLAVVALTLAMLALWTLYTLKVRRTGWKVLLAQAGIVAGVFALCWISALAAAFSYGYYMQGKAEKRGIAAWSFENKLPPELRPYHEKIKEFRASHPDFELPYDGIHRWMDDPRYGKLIPEEKRRYTLELFDTPECQAFCRDYEELMMGLAGRGPVYQDGLMLVRGYARVRSGRAALFHETKQPQKILAELMKITIVDTEILHDSPALIYELIRNAVRSIWYFNMVKIGPDVPEYAPVYREALELMKSRRVHVPLEYGFFLHMLRESLHFSSARAEQPGRYVEILIAPCQAAVAAKALAMTFSLEERAAAYRAMDVFGEQEAGRDMDGMIWNAARKSRISLVMGTTAIALKCYRVEKGAYPDKLEKLVPDYLDKLPVCPYTGKQLDYESDGVNFTFSLPDEARRKLHTVDNRMNY